MSFGVPPTRAAAVPKPFCQFVSCKNIIWLPLVSLKANALPLAWPVFLQPSILLEKALAFLHHCSASRRLKGFRKRERVRAPAAVFYHSFLESDLLCWAAGRHWIVCAFGFSTFGGWAHVRYWAFCEAAMSCSWLCLWRLQGPGASFSIPRGHNKYCPCQFRPSSLRGFHFHIRRPHWVDALKI